MKTHISILGLVIITLFASCKRDPTTTELLTDGSWNMKTLTINPSITINGVVITDYYNQLYDYDKDNILTFNTNGIVTSDEGPLKEFPSDPQTKQGNWLLSTSEDVITVYLNDDTAVYELSAISESQLTLIYSQRDTATQINYTLTAGYTHL
ncbi:MAG: hypothetical protein K9J17_02685 [Flavobacteriales bacterium]|nr:hypothetical protein [Flavobacteriales bacterium]